MFNIQIFCCRSKVLGEVANEVSVDEENLYKKIGNEI